MIIARKGIDYDYHTDSLYDIVECPECQTPLFGLKESDIGKEVECVCGRKVLLPDEPWVREHIEENTGQKTTTEPCGCGGILTKQWFKMNGKWRIGAGYCDKCGMRFIV